MRQLPLELGPEKPQTLATFVTGRNREAIQLLARLAAPGAAAPAERATYLWGEAGSGKTHLLRALAAAPRARYIAADAPEAQFRFAPDVALYLLDDCERLPPPAQILAFGLFNQAREHGAALVAAGAAPPADLPLREDLRTRLGWGLVYQIHGLSDDEKIDALTHAARLRGLKLSAGVVPYLITHFQRDMRSLSAMLDALDRYSLETQRAVTLPLLRDLLQLEESKA